MSKDLSRETSGASLTNCPKKVKIIRVERDPQQVPVEGFRSLGVVSIFIAGIESQCFSLVSSLPNDKRGVRFINSLLVLGLMLSSFGAITALMSARWFEVLGPDELELLEWRVTRGRAGHGESIRDVDLEKNTHPEIRGEIKEKVKNCENVWRNWILARIIFVPFLLTILGFCSFVVSMVAYTWQFQPLSTAIIATIASILGFFSMICMYLDHDPLVTIDKMGFTRLRI